jgi:hypothetical protein
VKDASWKGHVLEKTCPDGDIGVGGVFVDHVNKGGMCVSWDETARGQGTWTTEEKHTCVMRSGDIAPPCPGPGKTFHGQRWERIDQRLELEARKLDEFKQMGGTRDDPAAYKAVNNEVTRLREELKGKTIENKGRLVMVKRNFTYTFPANVDDKTHKENLQRYFTGWCGIGQSCKYSTIKLPDNKRVNGHKKESYKDHAEMMNSYACTFTSAAKYVSVRGIKSCIARDDMSHFNTMPIQNKGTRKADREWMIRYGAFCDSIYGCHKEYPDTMRYKRVLQGMCSTSTSPFDIKKLKNTYGDSDVKTGKYKSVCGPNIKEGPVPNLDEKDGTRQVITKAAVVHVDRMSRNAGILVYKRVSCFAKKCAVLKTGLCLDLATYKIGLLKGQPVLNGTKNEKGKAVTAFELGRSINVWSSVFNSRDTAPSGPRGISQGYEGNVTVMGVTDMVRGRQFFAKVAKVFLTEYNGKAIPAKYKCRDDRHPFFWFYEKPDPPKDAPGYEKACPKYKAHCAKAKTVYLGKKLFGDVCAKTCVADMGLRTTKGIRFLPDKGIAAAKCYSCPTQYGADICPSKDVWADEGACWNVQNRFSNCDKFKEHCGKGMFLGYTNEDKKSVEGPLDDVCALTCRRPKQNNPKSGVTPFYHQDDSLAKGYIMTF